MRNSFLCSITVAAAALAFSSFPAMAQSAAPADQNPKKGTPQYDPQAFQRGEMGPGGPAPVHDLSGSWQGLMEAALTNHVPAMTPAGQAHLKQNIPDPFSVSSNDPWKTCDPFGMPRAANNQTGEIGFAQMPNRTVLLEGFQRIWRDVWTDGRQLPKNVGHKGGPSSLYFGYSVGHWEGDTTFVVETVGMDPTTWVDRRGYPHSVDAKVTERFTRVDRNHMTLEETLDDPVYYTQPFLLAKNSFRWIQMQDDPSKVAVPFQGESLCIPSNAIEYMKLIAEPGDEDAVTSNKKPAKK